MNHDRRHGSARWSNSQERRGAGLYSKSGLQFGFDGTVPLRLDSQGPILTVAGARSGKLADVLLYNLCMPVTMLGHLLRAIIHDPKGELAAISFWAQFDIGRTAYAINPFKMHGLPAHKTNPLDILKPDSDRLMSDIQAIVSNLLPNTGNAREDYFKEQMRGWTELIIFWFVQRLAEDRQQRLQSSNVKLATEMATFERQLEAEFSETKTGLSRQQAQVADRLQVTGWRKLIRDITFTTRRDKDELARLEEQAAEIRREEEQRRAEQARIEAQRRAEHAAELRRRSEELESGIQNARERRERKNWAAEAGKGVRSFLRGLRPAQEQENTPPKTALERTQAKDPLPDQFETARNDQDARVTYAAAPLDPAKEFNRVSKAEDVASETSTEGEKSSSSGSTLPDFGADQAARDQAQALRSGRDAGEGTDRDAGHGMDMDDD